MDRQAGGDPVTGAPRWYLRLKGEEKEFVTVWLTLRQRTLRHECQFMPAPETNVEATWRYLLTRNADLLGMGFALGDEDAVYLVGRVPVSRVDDYELDRIVGCVAGLHRRVLPDGHDPGLRGPLPPPATGAALTAPGGPRGRW